MDMGSDAPINQCGAAFEKMSYGFLRRHGIGKGSRQGRALQAQRVEDMTRMMVGTAIAAAIAAGGMVAGATPAGAVVYCKTVGYPKGCVARPGVAVVHPVVRHGPVVYCKRVGYPKGCVAR